MKLPAAEVLEHDTEELRQLLTDFQESLQQAKDKLQPMLDKAAAGEIKSTAGGISYLEMKYNLMMQYCQFLCFYLLLKTEGC